jgi:hypothetical protein
LLSAVPPAVVSCAIFGSFPVTCTGPNVQVESTKIDAWMAA